MEKEKWFDRKWDLNFGPDRYAAIYLQLRQGPELLRQVTIDIAEDRLNHKPDGAWSIKEHAGHLCVMEPMWRSRFHDIDERKPTLTPADLDNRATTEAGFNRQLISALLDQFLTERNTTLALLDSLNMLDGSRTSIHPRLQQPMRMIDLAFFVAEHDAHHIRRVKEIVDL